MAMLGGFSSAQPKKSVPDGSSDMSDFVCPVCLEIFETPLTTQCGHTFCQSCLQECLRPQKPVCAVCRTALTNWTKAADLEALIHSSVAACKGCGVQVGLSQMRSHTAACSKYQEYIEEGVRSTAQSQPAIISPVPNRFTFSCPFCNCQNLDQDSLDYATDEATMIQEALQRSLMDNPADRISGIRCGECKRRALGVCSPKNSSKSGETGGEGILIQTAAARQKGMDDAGRSVSQTTPPPPLSGVCCSDTSTGTGSSIAQ
ncbi:hypothetical protein CCH79_00006726 [Gambusia affinis]|uniref:RING-type E3 ubiquitin transferase n=1 Tax=Gambusia affinis TaxID=33528 RepID=A0A315W7L6_GAMAF|nr:hypothetical protein CCH79_00006726 [Gambusia affinis]